MMERFSLNNASQRQMPGQNKKYRSKWFRVAVEGATTDGRQLDAQWLKEAADAYNAQVYGARVWIEHQRSLLPDGPFKAQGDVIALKTEEITIAGQKKLALMAQIEPTDELLRTVNALKQKIYTSIEINSPFADTGKAYLTGLAVTDSPASLGTDILTFAAQTPANNLFTPRKKKPGSLFTEAIETDLSFDEVSEGNQTFSSVKQRLNQLLNRTSPEENQKFSQYTKALDDLSLCCEKNQTDIDALKAACDQLRQDFHQLSTAVKNTPDPHQSSRPVVTGGNNRTVTEF